MLIETCTTENCNFLRSKSVGVLSISHVVATPAQDFEHPSYSAKRLRSCAFAKVP